MSARPHPAFPPRMANNTMTSVEQDSPEHVGQRCLLLLSVVEGTLIDTPGFGVPDIAFTPVGVGLDDLRAAVDEWIPAAAAVITNDTLIALARKAGVTVNASGGADG